MTTPPLNRPPHEVPEEKPLLYGDTPDQPIQGHKYDGIKEYDNPMPGWWLWLLWGTIAFSVVYYVGIEFFGFVDTYEDDLAEGITELEVIRHAYAEANPTFEIDEETLAGFVENPAMVQAGAAHYSAFCANCHGPEGQGLIGPNLTDSYWIHGGTNVDLFDVISTGVLDKGMPPWEGALSPEERGELVAFIRSIVGTSPPNPKEPQGEPVE